MPTTPDLVVNSLRDKVLTLTWDFSASAVTYLFVDNETDYNVIEVVGVIKGSPARSASAAAATLKVGTGLAGSVAENDDAFVEATTGPLQAVAVGSALSFTLTDVRKLAAGVPLIVTAAAGGTTDTAEALIQIRLRPMKKARGNSSKRPSSAQKSV